MVTRSGTKRAGRRPTKAPTQAPTGASTKAPTETLRLQVYRQLRGAIERGSFAPGARLPPSREHALSLGLARNTVLWALQRLQAEGYVVTRAGGGSFVVDDLGPLKTRRSAVGAAAGSSAVMSAVMSAASSSSHVAHIAADAALSKRGRWVADTVLRWQPPRAAAGGPLPFSIGVPEVAQFPFALWDRLSRKTTAQARQSAAQYLDPAGQPALREAIAQWLWVSRGIRCAADQVLVCSGSQQAIDLIGRLLLDVGDEVLVEDPGYPGIRASLAGQGATVRPVPVDDEGLDIESGSATWPQAKLVVVTPTHQYPLGVRMSLKRRLALLAWANAQRTWIVEDDYDGEFQYGTHRIPALCSLPHSERVLHVGTFSKTLHPGLRLGFVVLPPSLLTAFAAAKALADRHCPGDSQDTLARFIDEGHLLRHLRHMRELYLHRQQVLIEAMQRHSHGVLPLAPSEQGMHLRFELQGAAVKQGDLALSRAAGEAGVHVVPLSRYTITSARRGWLFGYAGFDEKALRAAAAVVGKLAMQAGLKATC
jgi:GntR family transcriptional regulator / MocR family aminotransferase